MKKVICFFILFVSFSMNSQQIGKPSEGKSLVYFVRSNSMGFLINFKYFDGEKYLGKFNHGKYLAYECEPGKHLFWAKSENVDFIEAELEVGKTYIIDSEPQMGAFKAGVKLIPFNNDPLSFKNEKKYNKKKNNLIECITSGELYKISEEDKKDQEADLKDLISRSMEKYNKLKSKNEETTKLPKEMFVE